MRLRLFVNGGCTRRHAKRSKPAARRHRHVVQQFVDSALKPARTNSSIPFKRDFLRMRLTKRFPVALIPSSLVPSSIIALAVAHALVAMQAHAQAPTPSDANTAANREAQSTQKGAQKTEQIETVTVTGSKRRQAEQDATQSLVVLTPDELINERDALDALARVPNLSFSSRSGLPTVRGVDGNGVAFGGGGAVSGGRPRFATYVDGVARSYSYAPDGNLTLWDVRQLEVYRGAQTTTLGRNSGAGALVVTTNDPARENQAALLTGYRTERGTWNAAAMANGAITDELALRVTAEGTHGETWRNPIGDAFGGKPRSELERQYFERYRFKALWAPSAVPGLSVRLTHDRQRDAQPNAVDTVIGQDLTRREIDAVNYSFFARRNEATSLQAQWEFADGWAADAVIARQRAETLGIPPVPGSANFLDIFARTTETSVEPKLTYTAGGASRTSAVVGVFWLNRDRNEGGAPGSAFPYSATDTAKARSLYADARVQLAPAWDLLVGLRAERETQNRDLISPIGLELKINPSVRKVLPKLGVDYRFSNDAALGIVAYQGYQAGGGGVSFQSFTPYTFRPETSTTAELTWRSQWLNRTLTVNANVFASRFKDYQLDGVGPGGAIDVVYLNAQRVTSRGAELEINWRASDAWTLYSQLGFLRAQIDTFDNAANSAVNGNRLQRAPRATARAGVRWQAWRGLTLSGDVYGAAGYFNTYQNINDERTPGYALLDLSAAWRIGPATFIAFVNNAANRFYVLDTRTGVGAFAQAGAPRTIGGSVRWDF
jgi:iron complex outermembrane recepter protein